MKEFNNWFVIGFEFLGEYIKHQIDVNSRMFFNGKPLGHWHYYFWYKDWLVDVFGSVDTEGNPRTDGDPGDGQLSAFGIDVYSSNEKHSLEDIHSNPEYMIDDIDFLECDL